MTYSVLKVPLNPNQPTNHEVVNCSRNYSPRINFYKEKCCTTMLDNSSMSNKSA